MFCKEPIYALPMKDDVYYKQRNQNNARPSVYINPYSATHTQEGDTTTAYLLNQIARTADNSHCNEHQNIDNNICLQLVHISNLVFVTFVSRTSDPRIKYKTPQKSLYDICNNARTTSDNADRVRLKLVFSTLAHTACKHNGYAHLLQHRGDI